MVVVTGSGFVPGATVSFGTTPSPAVSVTSATTLTALAPPGAVGSVDVLVTNPAGTSPASPADLFTYGDLEVTGVTPSGGAIATATPVTISGNGFAAGATVTFGGIAATDVVVVSANQITATARPSGPQWST